MTRTERQDSFLHAERHLKACSDICKHSQPSALMAYNMIRQLANDEFGNMEDYRIKHGDPTG
jgi:hypothetical protein